MTQHSHGHTNAGPDGSFVSTGACNLRVPGSNPGLNGYLSSWMCIYSATNCSKAWGVHCFLWYCAESNVKQYPIHIQAHQRFIHSSNSCTTYTGRCVSMTRTNTKSDLQMHSVVLSHKQLLLSANRIPVYEDNPQNPLLDSIGHQSTQSLIIDSQVFYWHNRDSEAQGTVDQCWEGTSRSFETHFFHLKISTLKVFKV